MSAYQGRIVFVVYSSPSFETNDICAGFMKYMYMCACTLQEGSIDFGKSHCGKVASVRNFPGRSVLCQSRQSA